MSEMVVPRDKYVREGGREAEREREKMDSGSDRPGFDAWLCQGQAV